MSAGYTLRPAFRSRYVFRIVAGAWRTGTTDVSVRGGVLLVIICIDPTHEDELNHCTTRNIFPNGRPARASKRTPLHCGTRHSEVPNPMIRHIYAQTRRTRKAFSRLNAFGLYLLDHGGPEPAHFGDYCSGVRSPEIDIDCGDADVTQGA